jgi:hypothetical protein
MLGKQKKNGHPNVIGRRESEVCGGLQNENVR